MKTILVTFLAALAFSKAKADALDDRGLDIDEGPEDLGLAYAKGHNIKCLPALETHDSHEDKVEWASTNFCNYITYRRRAIEAPIYFKTLIQDPYQLLMDRPSDPELDEPGPFLQYLGFGDKVGEDDWYEISVTGVTKSENKNCAEEGGEADGKSDLWRHKEELCEDIVYSAWKNCNNKGRGGSIDVGCVRYKIRTVW